MEVLTTGFSRRAWAAVMLVVVVRMLVTFWDGESRWADVERNGCGGVLRCCVSGYHGDGGSRHAWPERPDASLGIWLGSRFGQEPWPAVSPERGRLGSPNGHPYLELITHKMVADCPLAG